MPIYHLTEYSDNYSDTSGRLWQFKIDEQNMNNGKPVTTADSSSFKYKSSFLTNLEMSLIVKFILNYIRPKTV